MTAYTYKQIINKAKTCKTNVKTKYKLDMSDKWAYYFAKAILSPKKDIKKISFGDNPKPAQDKINTLATKAEYNKLAKDLVNFVEGPNKRLPNYVTFKGKKVAPRLLTYDFAKVLVKYDKNGKFQSEVKIVSSVFTKPKSKHGHATKKGCDNMGQNTGYYCACHSFQEVVRNLYGIVIPQKTLASVMGTTTSGTGHDGIRTAVAWFNKKYNKNLAMSEKYFSDIGVDGVKKIIASDNQDLITHIAYQKKYGHYEVVNSISGDTWNIQNSLGDKCSNGCYCGHKQARSYATEKSWINAKSGVKSMLIFTKK